MLDTDKLFKRLINDPDLYEIPFKYIVAVCMSVLRAINDGECKAEGVRNV